MAQAPVTGHDENGPTAGHLGDPPDLLSEVLAEPSSLPGIACGVIRIERENPALGVQVRKAIASNTDGGRVFRVFQRHGIPLSEQVIAKHMRGDCVSCQRLTS